MDTSNVGNNVNTNTTTTIENSDLAYVAASRRKKNTASDSLDFESYLKLMVAQLQNQDMYNPVDTKDMTSQLAQYSLVSAASSIMELQNTNYAASLVGKQVTAAYEDSHGNLVTNIGIVTGVTLYEGEPLIYVNGVPYNLGEVMIVGTTQKPSDSEDKEDPDKVEKPGGDDDDKKPDDVKDPDKNPPTDEDGDDKNPGVGGGNQGEGQNPPIDGDGDNKNEGVTGGGNQGEGQTPPADGDGSGNGGGQQGGEQETV